jgi:glycine dehydrogenase subunit 2
LFDDAWLKDTGVTTLDFAKAMIDEGYHPMTMYFPLVVHGAMLIEPTESESKASLDLFVATLRDLAMAAQRGDTERFTGAPYHAPRRRLDETRAARSPVLKWTPPQPVQEAAE